MANVDQFPATLETLAEMHRYPKKPEEFYDLVERFAAFDVTARVYDTSLRAPHIPYSVRDEVCDTNARAFSYIVTTRPIENLGPGMFPLPTVRYGEFVSTGIESRRGYLMAFAAMEARLTDLLGRIPEAEVQYDAGKKLFEPMSEECVGKTRHASAALVRQVREEASLTQA